MKITFKVSSGQAVPMEVDASMSIDDLKALAECEMNVPKDEMRMLFKGRVLKDEDTLTSCGAVDGAQLYIARGVSPARPDASSMVPTPDQMTPPPDPMAAMLNSPMMSGLMDNPEVLRAMLMSNPQMKEMMESNPELAHVLNDPATLRQSLASARDPKLQREQQRNTDRALSNIEAHPQGYNMLRRMYETLQALTDMGFPDRDANLRALVATGGNLEAAIARLVS